MTPQYTYDNKGKAIGVFLPIDEWMKLKEKYNELDAIGELPEWQKEILDKRLETITNPERVTSLDDFLKDIEQSEG